MQEEDSGREHVLAEQRRQIEKALFLHVLYERKFVGEVTCEQELLWHEC